MGSLVLEPKDVEILSKDELKHYWVSRELVQPAGLVACCPGQSRSSCPQHSCPVQIL